MRKLIAQREHVIAACRLAVKEVLDADDLNQEREVLEEKLLLLNERIRRLVNDNARMQMDQEAYQKEYDELNAQYGEATNRIAEIEEEARSREMRKKQIELFLRMFERQEADVEFDAGTFVAMVERAEVNRLNGAGGMELRFEFRNGETQRVEI